MPLGDAAPVNGLATKGTPASLSGWNDQDGNVLGATDYGYYSKNNDNSQLAFQKDTATDDHLLNVYADLSSATASTINQLRQAFQIQKLLERDARSGTRYAEIVKAHFGVSFMDVTYRPEFLGGTSTPINITSVSQSRSDQIPITIQCSVNDLVKPPPCKVAVPNAARVPCGVVSVSEV